MAVSTTMPELKLPLNYHKCFCSITWLVGARIYLMNVFVSIANMT